MMRRVHTLSDFVQPCATFQVPHKSVGLSNPARVAGQPGQAPAPGRWPPETPDR
jgi:hypothetical protein